LDFPFRAVGGARPGRSLVIRRSLALLAVPAAVAAASAAAAGAASACTGTCFTAPAGSGALFLFSGHGFGHGVGMSQYGAYGYAQHGASWQTILDHYYPGTTVGSASVTTVRVLLADKKRKLTLSSDTPYTVRDGNGTTYPLDAGPLPLGPGLRLPGTQQPLTPPLLFLPGRGSVLTLTRPYRGRIEVDVVDGKLRAINIVGLEQYLYGVVPSEMPSNWAPEALKAQAVAARSYALATKKVGAPFDAYADTRSQMYLGISHEAVSTTAAVDATRRQVLLYGGKIATTYFSSTSGGQTESSQAWIGTALPYLVSVPDPYDDISPYHNWGPVPVTAKTIAKSLKVTGPITDATATPGPSGRVGKLSLVTPLAAVQVSGTKLRSAIGLRSTWFTFGMLSLSNSTPNAPVTYGTSVALASTVRGVTGATLEQRTPNGTWQTVGPVGGGATRLVQRPTATTDYRLAIPTAAAAFVRIRVAPAISVTSFTTTLVAGSVQPLLPNAAVEVQQQNPDSTWTAVASGGVAADGTFSIAAQLAPGGTYRLSVAPGGGYAAGVTAGQVVVR
jgi:stage II sporulation protein D